MEITEWELQQWYAGIDEQISSILDHFKLAQLTKVKALYRVDIVGVSLLTRHKKDEIVQYAKVDPGGTGKWFTKDRDQIFGQIITPTDPVLSRMAEAPEFTILVNSKYADNAEKCLRGKGLWGFQ